VTEHEAEVCQLKQELELTKEGCDILKKSRGHIFRDKKMKFQFIDKNVAFSCENSIKFKYIYSEIDLKIVINDSLSFLNLKKTKFRNCLNYEK
jgi:hypothetical protein